MSMNATATSTASLRDEDAALPEANKMSTEITYNTKGKGNDSPAVCVLRSVQAAGMTDACPTPCASVCWLGAVKRTLREAGLGQDRIADLFSRVISEESGAKMGIPWTADLNQRRFELIDREIQGELNPVEQSELAALTRRMREHVESELSLPFEGAMKLHRYLTEGGSDSAGSQT